MQLCAAHGAAGGFVWNSYYVPAVGVYDDGEPWTHGSVHVTSAALYNQSEQGVGLIRLDQRAGPYPLIINPSAPGADFGPRLWPEGDMWWYWYWWIPGIAPGTCVVRDSTCRAVINESYAGTVTISARWYKEGIGFGPPAWYQKYIPSGG